MKKWTQKTVLLFLLSASLVMVSCGGSWVEMPGPMNKGCTEKKLDQIKKGGMAAIMFSATCKGQGKEYAGDVRCSDGKIQVKCK